MGTILHHIIRNKDFDAIYELLNALKPNQRFNFDTRNDDGNTIIHEMVKQNDYNELKHLLNLIVAKSKIVRCLKAYNKFGESPLYLAMERDKKTLKAMNKINDMKQVQNIENEQQQIDDLNINLIVDIDEKYDDNDNDIVIQQETLLNILHFL